jgi:hypothetical protein
MKRNQINRLNLGFIKLMLREIIVLFVNAMGSQPYATKRIQVSKHWFDRYCRLHETICREEGKVIFVEPSSHRHLGDGIRSCEGCQLTQDGWENTHQLLGPQDIHDVG